MHELCPKPSDLFRPRDGIGKTRLSHITRDFLVQFAKRRAREGCGPAGYHRHGYQFRMPGSGADIFRGHDNLHGATDIGVDTFTCPFCGPSEGELFAQLDVLVKVVACQSDGMVTNNEVIFPISHFGQRNGSRAPQPSATHLF